MLLVCGRRWSALRQARSGPRHGADLGRFRLPHGMRAAAAGCRRRQGCQERGACVSAAAPVVVWLN
jgi:hypothetical protein